MYKTDNCTLSSITILLGLNLVMFTTFLFFLITNSLNPIFQNKSQIVSSKRVNIEGHLIQDIYSTSQDSCREAYQPLFRQLSTGPSLGYCKSQTPDSTKIKGLTGSSELQVGLSNDSLCPSEYVHVPATNGMGLFKLESKLVCAKFIKASELNYEISNTSKCSSGLKVCGQLTMNYFCLSEQEECPVNGVHVQTGISSFHDQEKYHRIELGNNVFLYFSKLNTGGLLLTDDWILASPKGVCLNPLEIEASQEMWPFWQRQYLDTCRSVLNDVYYDKDYSLIYQTSWNRILENNDLKSFVAANNLDLDLKKFKDWEVGIFQKSKIYFNKECKDYKSTYDQTFEKFGNSVNYEYIFILLTVAVVLNLCAIIMLIVLLLFGCLLKKGKYIRNYTINWKTLVKSLSSVAFFNACMIILLIASLILIKQNKNYVYLEAKRQGYTCVDDNLSSFINFFLNTDSKIFDVLVLILSFGVVSSMSYIVFFLLIIRNFDKFTDPSSTPKNTISPPKRFANSNSAENIQKLSKTTSSTKSKYSQKSKEEIYHHYSKIMFSGGYISKDHETWQSIELGVSKELRPEQKSDSELKEYIYIDGQQETNISRQDSTPALPELDLGYAQFLKKETLKNSSQRQRSNSMSEVSQYVDVKSPRNDSDFVDYSKFSSGDGQNRSFGLLRLYPETGVGGGNKNSQIRLFDQNDESAESGSSTFNNTSINQINVNFVKKNILGHTKEEISSKLGSYGDERNLKSSQKSL